MNQSVRSRSTLFVEFAGLPGCGKSTIVAALLNKPNMTLGALQGGGIHTVTARVPLIAWAERSKPLRALIFLAILVSHHFSIFTALLTYCLECGTPLFTRFRYAFIFIRLLIRSERAKQSEAFNGTTLLDEGFVQAIASIGVPGHTSASSMRKLLTRTLPNRIDAIVMLECTPATLNQRIDARQSQASRFDRWSSAERIQHLSQLNMLLRKNTIAAEEIGIPVLRISSEEPIETSTRRVIEWLSDIHNAHRRPTRWNANGR
jgi:thymidylate kinase